MLAVSVVGQAASAVMINGPAFLIPTLHRQLGLSLAEAGLVAAASTIGVMVSLIAWGYVADRFGERFAMVSGLTGTAAAGVLATQVTSTVALAVALFLAGCFAASTSSASGRVVVGWFPANRRGLAMGIRQMAQPVGVGIAAITIAVVASKHGISAALWIPTTAPPPTPTGAVTSCFGSTASRSCWSCRSSLSGRSAWSGSWTTVAGARVLRAP
jgi:sugar phosphate permease